MLFDVQINDRGQITIPKELRDTVNLQAHDKLKLSINAEGRIVLYKSDFFDDVEDLIRKDLESEGLSDEQVEKKLPERKKELGKALLKMAMGEEYCWSFFLILYKLQFFSPDFGDVTDKFGVIFQVYTEI